MKVGLIFGCWDLFHVGHLRAILAAKTLCDFLIVGVYSNKVIKEFKGVYPVIGVADRMEIIRNLSCVNMVWFIPERPCNEMSKVPNLLFVSSEWKGKKLPFKPKDYKGKIVYIPYTKNISTNIIKNKIRNNTYY